MSTDPADYNLQYIAEHNARFPDYQQEGDWNPNSFNFDLDHPQTNQSYTYADTQSIHTGSAPVENPEVVNAIRTRSGRVTRRTQSPQPISRGVSKSRKSKSPRPKKAKAGRSEKIKTINIPGPLSEITKGSSIPVRDIEAWVNRPAADRHEETMKRKGYIARPMNSFMLYRSAYAERTKEWCKENDHQVVSSAAGESWPMESDELRNQFQIWAKVERDNHAVAFPNYKFSPSKTGVKRRDEDDGPDPDLGDSDAEYRPSRKMQRQFASPYQASVRSNSPAISEAYSSGVEYIPGEYPWLPQQIRQQPRPLPAPHSYQPDPYHRHPQLDTSLGMNHSFTFPRDQQVIYQPTDASWQMPQFDSHQSLYGPITVPSSMPQQFWPQQSVEYQSQSLQSPPFDFLSQGQGQLFSEFGVDPRLTTTELDDAYGRDLDRNKNALQ
ncbi:Transcription factor ste11 [Sphaceloma murrayae]|uniref:Transcription factor ste11 n=1 Tax=Sphaceloma murrayae TaxID=2082308 RepID=A0A2K1QY33_9PEZI|nr:Transcription factor ste11 [Sphaceloma murrayae]